MKIINKAQCALAPLTIMCSISNATSFTETITNPDKTELTNTIKKFNKLEGNDATKALLPKMETITKNDVKASAEIYMGLKGLPNDEQTNLDVYIQDIYKMTLDKLLELGDKDNAMLSNCTNTETRPYDSTATRPTGIIDTTGNKTKVTTNLLNKTETKELLADTKGTAKGRAYLLNHIKVTSDKTISEALLDQLIKDKDWEITEANKTKLESDIAAIKLKDNEYLQEILVSGVKTSKTTDLKSALSKVDQPIDSGKTCEENVIKLIGEKEFKRIKGVKREGTVKSDVISWLKRHDEVMDKTTNVLDTTFTDEAAAEQLKEIENNDDIKDMIRKLEAQKKALANKDKEIADKEQDIAQKEHEINTKTSEIDSKNQELEDTKKELTDKENELQLTKAALKAQEIAEEKTMKRYGKKIADKFGIKLDAQDTPISLIELISMSDVKNLIKKHIPIVGDTSQLEAIIKAQEAKIKQLEEAAKKGGKGLLVNNTELTNALNEIKDLRTKNDQLQEELKKANDQLQDAKNKANTGGLTEDIKKTMRYMYKKLNGDDQKELSDQMSWLKDKTLKAILVPIKDK